jgi:hypothetical protein
MQGLTNMLSIGASPGLDVGVSIDPIVTVSRTPRVDGSEDLREHSGPGSWRGSRTLASFAGLMGSLIKKRRKRMRKKKHKKLLKKTRWQRRAAGK